MDVMEHWEAEATTWVRHHIDPELLEDWLFAPSGDVRSLDEVWKDLEQARATSLFVEARHLQAALCDLYCAAYRWHLLCACRELSTQECHRLAMVSAVAEVRTTQAHALSQDPQAQARAAL